MLYKVLLCVCDVHFLFVWIINLSFVLRLTKICRQNTKFLLKWDRNIGHFTGRPECVYIVGGSTKCFVDPQQCNCRLSLATVNSFLLTATYAAQQYSFGSATTTVTRCAVTSHVRCLSALLVAVFNACSDRFGMVHVLNPFEDWKIKKNV